MRLFVGVWLSDTLQDEVMAYIEHSRKDISGWKWSKRQNLHFTLKFLGEVSENRLSELSIALESAANQNQPFTLQLGSIGFFPEKGKPRIMWVGAERGEEELIQLADFVEQYCLKQGFEKSGKPFQAHLTMARAREEVPRNDEKNTHIVQGKVPDASFNKANFKNNMLVQGISLVESNLYSSGAIYKTIKDFQFGKPD